MRISFIAVIGLLFIDLLTALYLYRRIIAHYFRSKIVKWGYGLLNALLIAGFAGLTYIIKSKAFDIPSPYLMWTAFIYFLFFNSKLLYAVLSVPDYLVSAIRKRKCRVFSAIGATLSGLLFTGMLWGATIDRTSLRIEPVEIAYRHLPKAFDGYRIVQLSDIHLGNYIHNPAFIEELVSKVNALDPDLILFTGDLVNVRGDELPEYMPILSRLKAKDGVFSVLGNHDYGDYTRWKSPEEKRENLKRLIANQEKMGWHILNNASKRIGRGSDSIALIGVENWGEPPFPQHGDLSRAMQGIPDSIFKILMTHNPVHWDAEVVPNTDIDLSLAGHTHAMQMKFSIGKFKWSPAEWAYDRWSGLYRKGDQYLYVNEGTGYVFIPLRFGTKPEITRITLVGK